MSEFVRQVISSLNAELANLADPITERDLDQAGVRDWRGRLRSARQRDEQEFTHRKHFDLAWAAIRAEYRERA